MFSISAIGLCWGTRAIIGEFHAITVEQYTQQVSVHPTVAWVLLNILTALLTACPETATRGRRSCCLFQKAWHGSARFSLLFHLLALSCMLSCWILSLHWIILLHMPPLNSSGLRGVWCATRRVSAHPLLHTYSVQHVPTPPNPHHPSTLCLREDGRMYSTLLCTHCQVCVVSLSPFWLWAQFLCRAPTSFSSDAIPLQDAKTWMQNNVTHTPVQCSV